MNHLRALISESPEELPQAFFKELKNFSTDHKVKVWSRKNSLPLDYDFYFLSYRDFTYLKKLKQLPLSHKICVLATTANLDLSFKETSLTKISCYIIGTEESRGSLAAKFFSHLCNYRDGLIKHQIHETSSLDCISNLSCADWLKGIIKHTLFELLSIDQHKEIRFLLNEGNDEIKITVDCKLEFPSIDLFSKCFSDSGPESLDLETLKVIALKSLLRSVSQTIIYPGQDGSTLFELTFMKAKTQRKYEQASKLFGINHQKVTHV